VLLAASLFHSNCAFSPTSSLLFPRLSGKKYFASVRSAGDVHFFPHTSLFSNQAIIIHTLSNSMDLALQLVNASKGHEVLFSSLLSLSK